MRTETFSTQEEILNFLGKKNDRNLIQRKIRRGEIYKEDGMYYLVINEGLNSLNFEQTAKILELSSEVDRLKEENKALRMVNEELKKENNSDSNPTELEEAREQWKYFERLSNSRKDLIDKVIHETYVIVKSKLGNKMEGESEFKAAIIKRAKGISD